jgi:PKD repeat protein
MKGLSLGSRVVAAVAALSALAVFAPSAGAVLVHVSKHQVAGVAPKRGVKPASIRGSFAASGSAKRVSSNGNLDYHGGPVLHSSAPYLIFWDPNSQLSASTESLLERYFADVAHDTGLASNVFAVDRQFTDTTGFAAQSERWASTHAIVDKQAYPTSGQCTENAGYTETACLYDSQLQAEVARLVAADHLPTGTSGTAPIYEVVTPPTVNSCFSDNSTCADNYFCAYHSNFTDSSTKTDVLYADIPTLLAQNDPKGCQYDGNTAVQEPNGNQISDVTTKYMSHETNETITDPTGNAWWDSNSGNEDGDNCNFYGSFDPQGGYNPNAFKPYLGGTAASGTLYDQIINTHHYYTQTEWSNGNVTCEAKPVAASLAAKFTGPTTGTHGTPVTFTPTGSSSAAGYSSTTWYWGDGSNTFTRAAPAAASHTYTKAGTYTVTLTVVDKYGNLSHLSKVIKIS